MSAAPKSQQKPIVFVVDDDISVRESLELLIKFAGWQPETFASAGEFLGHPRTTIPSCLVLDISLPDLNGLELQKNHLHHGTWRCSYDSAGYERGSR